MVLQLMLNFLSISKIMLHCMEGKFYVGSLEVHKPSPSPNPNPNPSPSPNPNHVPYWEGKGGGT